MSGRKDLMQSYYLYAALLAVKLLLMIPLASITCNKEKVQRANLSDLKHLTPFWLLAPLYVTTCPDPEVAINLMRVFFVARIISALGYICRLPRKALEGAFFASFVITAYMGMEVICAYKKSF